MTAKTPETASVAEDDFNQTHFAAEQLHVIVNTVADGIIAINERGVIKFFNPAATHIFGYTPDEVLGQNITMLMAAPFQNEHQSYVDNYLTTNIKKVIGSGIESKGLRKDGGEFPLELAITETFVDGKRLFIGTVRDITHQKKNQELIARLGSIVNDSSDEIYLLRHHDLSFMQTNESARRNLGYSTHELRKLTFRELLPVNTLDTFSRLLAQLNEGGASRISFETELRRKNGSFYPVEVKIYLSSFELEKVYVTIIQDISERKQTEKALRDKNAQIEVRSRYDRVARLIIAKANSTYDAKEVLNDALTILADQLDYKSSAVYFFDEWTGCLHLKASYAPPQSLKEIFRLGEGLIGQAASQKRSFVIADSESEPLLTIDTGILSIRPAAVLVYPFAYQERLVGVISLACTKTPQNHDLSFIEGLLAQLAVSLNSIKQYNDLKELSDQLKKRGREVAEKNAELEQANRMKSEFLANISHELRTPLNAVIGFSEVLKDGVLGDLSDKQLEYATDIFKSGQHLLSLINDILDLSKIEAGKMSVDPELVNMKELIRNSVSIVKERAFAKKVALSQEVDEEILPILADARQIKQVVYNLLSNAVKFTPNGGKVSIRGYRENDKFFISVKDTGIGISQEDQARLFRPFEQLDSSVSRKYEGSGLGLVLAKRFAELHGGDITVQSRLNEGSCFTIAIPYRTEDSVSKVEAPVVAETIQNIIEQQKDLLLLSSINGNPKFLQHQAEHHGYKVHKVFSPASLIKHIKFSPPQLIVVDEKLTLNDSFDLMDKINSLTTSLPILFMHGQHSGVVSGLSAASTNPTNQSELISAINEYQAISKKSNDELKILVVDDDPHSVELIARSIEEHRYPVMRTYSGEEAIETCLSVKPDVIILDLLMPNVSGHDVIKAIRNQRDDRNYAIIILTAINLSPSEAKHLSRDVFRVIKKSSLNSAHFTENFRVNLASNTSNVLSPHTQQPHLAILTEDNDKLAALQQFMHTCHLSALLTTSNQLLRAEPIGAPNFLIASYVHDAPQVKAYLTKIHQQNIANPVPLLVYNNLDLAFDTSKDVLPDLFMDAMSILGLQPISDTPRTVLVIDDDAKASAILTSTLLEANFKVMTASTGKEGLQLARKHIPDAIIIDLVMADLSGFDVVDGLKHDKATCDIPLIVLTSKTLSPKEHDLLSNHVDIIAQKYETRRRELIHNIDKLINRGDTP